MKGWKSLRLILVLTLFYTLAAATAHSAVRGSPYWTQKGQGWIVYSVPTKKPLVAFTFDDGPSPEFTPQILKALHQHHARATFFVIGQVARQYPELLRQISQQGNEIGNHTEHHQQQKTVTLSEIKECDETVRHITGVRPQLLRPPGGHLTTQLLQMARATHHTIAMWTWDVDAKDWSRPGVNKIVRTVLEHIDPGDILIFHDGGGKRTQTIQALPIILDRLQQMGYHFVTVSEILKEGAQSSQRSNFQIR